MRQNVSVGVTPAQSRSCAQIQQQSHTLLRSECTQANSKYPKHTHTLKQSGTGQAATGKPRENMLKTVRRVCSQENNPDFGV